MIFDDKIWKNLESESPTGDKVVAHLALPELSRKLYAGLDANKQRHLLILLNEKDEEFNDSQSRGFVIVTRDLIVQDSKSQKYIDIICHDNSGHVIFNAIGGEIAEKLEKSKPKEVIANVVAKWRRFWGTPPRDILSREELIGLIAELWFLYHWLLPRIKYLDAIKMWRGPFSSRHDFESKSNSIEVKATTNVQYRIHKIHGLEQLSPPEKGDLLFFSLRLREEQGSKNTLPEFISLFKEKLKDNLDALSLFENTLAVTGYSPLHDEEYNKFKFRVVDEKLYSVKDEFPRLTINSFNKGLPSGVGTVEYTINLDGFENLCLATSPENKIKLL
ncbi:PD-(D/E)XK motif protein [Candidatus Woesearchaeota archaeon]|nr:PD-(D/E)XK motif protein [Candidatus Woesearchaeota archaeon]